MNSFSIQIIQVRKHLCVLFVVLLGGCSVFQKKEDIKPVQLFESQLQVTNLRKKQSAQLSADVYKFDERTFRIEVTGTLGAQVAQILIEPKKATFILPQKKECVVQSFENDFVVLEDLGYLSVHRDWLSQIFNSQNLNAPVCFQGKKSCFDGDKKVKFSMNLISERTKKMIEIENESSKLKWLIPVTSTSVQKSVNLKQIKCPEGYLYQTSK